MSDLLGYNILKYIMSIIGGDKMQIESIISRFTENKRFNLNSQVTEYLHYIDEEVFYVPPSFKDVKTNVAASTLNPKFILFSAPGATGKSALAMHLAKNFNALYWDSSKITVGTGTFSGSIIKAVGDQEYSSFIKALNISDAMLVVDALDEAEIISGRVMLGEFISDMSEILNNHNNPNIILLARTETAQFIATYCAENEIPLLHYEIGFFEEIQAKNFIIKKAKLKTDTDKKCVDEYYRVINNSIDEEESISFLGYAPVLEAISEHIKQNKNRLALFNGLSAGEHCVDIIIKILDDLLDREQNDKVINAMRQKCEEKGVTFTEWDKLYTKNEQLIRVVNYILFGETDYESYCIDCLPPYLVEDYQEILKRFLPQHPFIRNEMQSGKYIESKNMFTGPAFRDYALANLVIEKDYEALAQMFFDEVKDESHFPSQLFFEFYSRINNNIIHSEHLSLLYESFKSKATANEYPYLQCYQDAYISGDFTVIFEMISSKKSSEIPMNMIIDKDTITMGQLINVSLDIPNLSIEIKNTIGNARIANSMIRCRNLILGVDNIIIESYKHTSCVIVCGEKINGHPKKIDIPNPQNIYIDSPNITDYYKLIQFKCDFEDGDSVDIKRVIYIMRCILLEFRTHKKDTLAKDAERIDNVIVGKNKLKKSVLDFFKAYGVVYESAHLYKINIEKMEELGLNYSALMKSDYEQLKNCYEKFNEYYSAKIL